MKFVYLETLVPFNELQVGCKYIFDKELSNADDYVSNHGYATPFTVTKTHHFTSGDYAYDITLHSTIYGNSDVTITKDDFGGNTSRILLRQIL